MAIAKEKEHFAVMYVSPKALKQLTGGKPLSAGSIENVWVEVLRQGQKLDPQTASFKGGVPKNVAHVPGFVLRKDGYILTNNHVVHAATATGKITVLFSDGKRADAKIIGRDESYDLAVIRVDRKGLPALTLGNSSAVVGTFLTRSGAYSISGPDG